MPVQRAMRESGACQDRFRTARQVTGVRLLENNASRGNNDFLLLRAATGEADQALADWWTHFQTAGDDERRAMTAQMVAGRRTSKRKRVVAGGQSPRRWPPT